MPTLEPVQFDLGKFGSSVVALWRHYCQLSYKAPLFINFYACLPNITWFFIAIYIAVIPILIHVSMWFFNFKFLLGSLINHLKCLIPWLSDYFCCCNLSDSPFHKMLFSKTFPFAFPVNSQRVHLQLDSSHGCKAVSVIFSVDTDQVMTTFAVLLCLWFPVSLYYHQNSSQSMVEYLASLDFLVFKYMPITALPVCNYSIFTIAWIENFKESRIFYVTPYWMSSGNPNSGRWD